VIATKIPASICFQLEQNKIDGEKTVIQNPTEAQRKEHEKYDFELHEVTVDQNFFSPLMTAWQMLVPGTFFSGKTEG